MYVRTSGQQKTQTCSGLFVDTGVVPRVDAHIAIVLHEARRDLRAQAIPSNPERQLSVRQRQRVHVTNERCTYCDGVPSISERLEHVSVVIWISWPLGLLFTAVIAFGFTTKSRLQWRNTRKERVSSSNAPSISSAGNRSELLTTRASDHFSLMRSVNSRTLSGCGPSPERYTNSCHRRHRRLD